MSASTISRRAFVYEGGTSHKFWTIEREDRRHTVHYGRVGTDGQRKTKTFASPSAAERDAGRLIAQKQRKGYREVEHGRAATAATEEEDDTLLFVYRTPYEGPSGKRVVTLPGGGALGWVRQALRKVQRSDVDAEDHGALYDLGYRLVKQQCKGRVYGLEAMFVEAMEAEAPQDWDELEEFLHEHLSLEGGLPDVAEPTVRALTDDDELELAFMMFPQSYAEAHPERTAWLLRKDWRLPQEVGRGGFEPPVALDPVSPAGSGEGATYVVSLDVGYEGGQLSKLDHGYGASVLEGVRLPGLTAYLRGSGPAEDWPEILLALRAATGAKDRTPAQPLLRCAKHGVRTLAELSEGSYAEVRQALGEQWPEIEAMGSQARGTKRVCSEHLLQLVNEMEEYAGPMPNGAFEHWVLFDDLWASAHPDLASSLLWAATGWDPLREE